MTKNYFNILFLLFTISFSSCSKKEEVKVDVSKNKLFFDIVYNTKYYRITGATAWRLVSGDTTTKCTQTLQFKRDATTSEDASETNSGSFSVTYSSYLETGLANASQCSGGYTGTFISEETDGTSDGETSTENPQYDPNTPYTPIDAGGVEKETKLDKNGNALPDDYYNFSFDLNVLARSLSAGCNAVRPLDTINLDVLRFTSNGDLIVTDYNRGIEFYMIPVTKNAAGYCIE